MKIEPLNESSVLISFDNDISESVLDLISVFCQLLTSSPINSALIEVVPSYNTVMLVYRLSETDYDTLYTNVLHCYQRAHQQMRQIVTPRKIQLAVYYSQATGPDLSRLSQQAKLSVADVIELHSQPLYRVYAIGFSPGFPYLASVNERIAMPRLRTPRKSVPAGSVGIADSQTGIYAKASPGGWNIIGNCPEPLLNAQLTCRLKVGDTVQFVAIDQTQYFALGGQLRAGFNEL